MLNSEAAFGVRCWAFGIFNSSISGRPRFVAAPQNCVVKIGRMRFARIEGDDHTLMLEIDFYIMHAFNFHERPAQLSHSLMVILAFGADFNGF